LLIDQTAHEQVYFFTRFFEDRTKNAKTVQVLKALRGGNQPTWFQYGNDKRSDVCCWYNESLNGMALLKAYEDSGDSDALLKGYAGVTSVMANVLPDGMGFNFFISTPGIFGPTPPRTFESGSGLWGFLRSAKSYIVKDPSFGVIGYGCRVDSSEHETTAYPNDGLKKRLLFVDHKINVEVTAGEIDQASLNHSNNTLSLRMSDSTGLVKNVTITIDGLPDGNYRLDHGKSSRHTASKGKLAAIIPITEAGHVVLRMT